ncbi:MAG: DUF1295 domain-containing protein [Bacteroidetes bacterium]|nr:DUF1295 domain-containing protein [Bacteroidota bacterium]
MKKQLDRIPSLFICIIGYLFTLVGVLMIAKFIPFDSPVLTALILDLAATVIIFIFSVSFNNSSFYDPYWSVAPVPILIYWYISAGHTTVNPVRQILIITLVVIWSVRLTYNCFRRWKGMQDEDWRYVNYRKNTGRFYWVISFFGIHLFPTLIVFLGCLAVYPALALDSSPIGIFDVIAAIIVLSAIIIETVADRQLQIFISKPAGNFLSSGLWKYSRHPNYFGEVLFWIGLWVFSLVQEWWTIPGPVAMILLFAFISVPMMDKKMVEQKNGYRDYMKKTSALIPWF